MSRSMVELRWSIIVADPEHWTPDHLAQAEAAPEGGYDDWVRDQLVAAMEEAGRRWIETYPDLVDGDLV